MSLLSSVLFLVCVQDPSAGVQKFAAGDFPGAVTAFEEAAKKAPDLAALQYDLAVAAFRAQDLATAEEAIERYAAMPSGGRADLHHGMLGNIRYRQAEARAKAAVGAPPPMPLQSRPSAPSPAAEPKDPVAELEAAVQLAEAARAAFVRAACAKEAGPEVARNTERAVRLREQLKKQLEEAKKQRDEQQKDDQQKQDGDQKKDDQKKDDQKQDDKKQDQKNNDQQKNDEQKSDPSKSDDEQKPKDPSKDDEKSKQEQEPPKDGASRPEPKPEDQQGKENQEGKQEPQPAEPEGQKDKADAPNKDGDAAPEPKGDGAPKPEPEKPAGDEQSQAAASEAARNDAPGERPAGTELSPEQQARMMEQLKELDQRLRQIRAAARSGRRPVERDW